jgi:hypothetical protein
MYSQQPKISQLVRESNVGEWRNKNRNLKQFAAHKPQNPYLCSPKKRGIGKKRVTNNKDLYILIIQQNSRFGLWK